MPPFWRKSTITQTLISSVWKTSAAITLRKWNETALDEAHGAKIGKNREKSFLTAKIKKKSLPVGSRCVGSVGPPETQVFFFWPNRNSRCLTWKKSQSLYQCRHKSRLLQRGCRSDIYTIPLHFSPSSLDFVPKSHTPHKANSRAEPMQHSKDTVFEPTAATNVTWNRVLYEVKHRGHPSRY